MKLTKKLYIPLILSSLFLTECSTVTNLNRETYSQELEEISMQIYLKKLKKAKETLGPLDTIIHNKDFEYFWLTPDNNKLLLLAGIYNETINIYKTKPRGYRVEGNYSILQNPFAFFNALKLSDKNNDKIVTPREINSNLAKTLYQESEKNKNKKIRSNLKLLKNQLFRPSVNTQNNQINKWYYH